MSEKATSGWAGRLRTALAMGLAPEAFWRLSLREWRMLTAAPDTGFRPMSRAEFEALDAADRTATPSPGR